MGREGRGEGGFAGVGGGGGFLLLSGFVVAIAISLIVIVIVIVQIKDADLFGLILQSSFSLLPLSLRFFLRQLTLQTPHFFYLLSPQQNPLLFTILLISHPNILRRHLISKRNKLRLRGFHEYSRLIVFFITILLVVLCRRRVVIFLCFLWGYLNLPEGLVHLQLGGLQWGD